jgi:hypothetical protein
VQEGDEGYAAAHVQWEKRGAVHLRKKAWERKRSVMVQSTTASASAP